MRNNVYHNYKIKLEKKREEKIMPILNIKSCTELLWLFDWLNYLTNKTAAKIRLFDKNTIEKKKIHGHMLSHVYCFYFSAWIFFFFLQVITDSITRQTFYGVFKVISYIFFRKMIKTSDFHLVPNQGLRIFIVDSHANQFIDSIIFSNNNPQPS